LFTIVHDRKRGRSYLLDLIGSSGWTSNPPVNRRKTAVLPPVAAPCADAPDRELDPINTGPIDDQRDAAISRPNPRLDVSKGQEKGETKAGGVS
jgi:hypothetical protein